MAHRSDIRIKERKVFLLLIFLYLVFRWFRANEMGPEVMHSYGADLLFVPILMTSMKIVRFIFNFSFAIGKKEVAIAVLYSAIVFEWLLPKQGTNFVSDPFDILSYSVGALVYVLVIARDTTDTIEKNKPLQTLQ